MKTTAHSIRLLALAGAATLAGLSSAAAQNIFVDNGSSNTIGDYNISSGSAVAVPFAPAGINGPQGIAVSGNTLYVDNSGTSTLNAYNATTGASLSSFSLPGTSFGVVPSGGNLYVDNLSSGTVSLVNATTGAAVTGFTTITGQNQPTGLALLGNTLYVNNTNGGGGAYINAYNATTGVLIMSHFEMNLGNANFLAAAGNTLYDASYGNNTIYAFNATTGAALAGYANSDTGSPNGIAVSGNNLFTANLNSPTVSEYNAATGALVNSNFITGLTSGGSGLAVGVPEPSTWVASLGGLGMLGVVMIYRRRRARLA